MRIRYRHILSLLFALAFSLQGQSRAFMSPLPEAKKDKVTSDNQLGKLSYEGRDYYGNPWMLRTSHPFTATRGLAGRHLSVWASHGRYFDHEKASWKWQRPYLFCSTEDMLTQSFVYPFLIPMLENAGAVVFTPRERDYQKNEAIVDNDTPARYGTYSETGMWQTARGPIGWGTVSYDPETDFEEILPGFGLNYAVLNDTVMPFRQGTAKMINANTPEATASWMPQIPDRGHYAVYVSYMTLPNSVNDAHYTVYHAGGKSTFTVNQQMGGGTWLYLGTFLFDAGQSENNRVVLSSESQQNGVVTADAVRFGGGRSLIERCDPEVTYTYENHTRQWNDSILGACEETITDTIPHYKYGKGTRSGLARFLEASRYYCHFAGLPDTLVSHYHGLDDYKDDLRARSYMINTLAGGSCFVPDTIGRKVPIELQFALHTDAGVNRDGSVYGALTITTPYDDNGVENYRSGLSRKVSENYASHMLDNISSELSKLYKVNWPARDLYVRNYAETRSPQMPSIILELLSHQSFKDMTYAHDPNFKFMASRIIYKTLLREIYTLHNLGEPTIQPLPVTAVCATLGTNPHTTIITWKPQEDPMEASATPTNYILYCREGDRDWNEGILTGGNTAVEATLKPGVHYQFRIGALNAGGESFPSEPVSVYIAPDNATTQQKTILLVNAFDRLSGPARIQANDKLGFDLKKDVGVSYEVNSSLTGSQKVYDASRAGREGTSGLGYSGGELVGLVLAGNKFDGFALHTGDIVATHPEYNVVSMSREAFDGLSAEALIKYALIDYIAGLQVDVDYNIKKYTVFTPATQHLLTAYSQQGGCLLVSGSHLAVPAASADSLTQATTNQFLAQTLHTVYRDESLHNNSGTFVGLGMEIPIYNSPNELHYPCQQSDIIEPADDKAFTAFAYDKNGYCAGIAWPRMTSEEMTAGPGVVMSFPYDCISDKKTRRTAMSALLDFLQ